MPHRDPGRERSWSAPVRWWNALAVLGVFTALGVLFSTQIYLDSLYTRGNVTRGQALTLALAGWYGWAALSPAVLWLARRFPFTPPTRAKSIGVHLVGSLVFTFGKLAATGTLLAAAGFGPRQVTSTINIPLNYLTYWAIVGIVWAIDTHRARRAERLRAAQLEASLATARLDALMLQLQPHFLFNTLNSIAELMHENVSAAERMVSRLSVLLRASLDASRGHEISLDEELAFLEHYVSIERVRFDERLRVEVIAPAAARAALVPRLLLQPLVENAVRHAVAPRAEGGTITVEAARRDDRLTIRVADNGPGPLPVLDGTTNDGAGSSGIGLANTRARLEALYGDQQTFEIRAREGGGADVRIDVPFRVAIDSGHAAWLPSER